MEQCDIVVSRSAWDVCGWYMVLIGGADSVPGCLPVRDSAIVV